MCYVTQYHFVTVPWVFRNRDWVKFNRVCAFLFSTTWQHVPSFKLWRFAQCWSGFAEAFFSNKNVQLTHKLKFDDNTGIFHIFEMWIGMNEFDHCILALLKQQRERSEQGFEPWPLWCQCSALLVELSGQLGSLQFNYLYWVTASFSDDVYCYSYIIVCTTFLFRLY